jgi:hypothetical protein
LADDLADLAVQEADDDDDDDEQVEETLVPISPVTFATSDPPDVSEQFLQEDEAQEF